MRQQRQQQQQQKMGGRNKLVPVGSTKAWERILDAVGAQHISNLAEEAVPVIPELGHVYTLAKTRPP